MVISWRDRLGRFANRLMGPSMPCAEKVPVIFTEEIDFHFSTPPLAFRFLATISSTVCAVLTTGKVSATIRHAAIENGRRMKGLLTARGSAGRSKARF